MGVYIFNYDTLEHALRDDRQGVSSSKDFGKDIVPHLLEEGARVFAYPYGGYWIDVGTIEAYWEAHMDLLASPPSLNLNDRTWVIHTRSEERPPVRINDKAEIRNSLITDGAIIAKGAVVERSVLSPGVYVGPGAVVRESVILNDAYIEAGATVERAIIDKIVVVGQHAKVGSISEVGDLNITAIGKNTHIPPRYSIGAGSTLGTDLTHEDFEEYSNKVLPANTRFGFTARK